MAIAGWGIQAWIPTTPRDYDGTEVTKLQLVRRLKKYTVIVEMLGLVNSGFEWNKEFKCICHKGNIGRGYAKNVNK